MSQEKYIGMDVHQATISVAVMDAGGKLIMECLLETKAATIVQFMQGLQGTRSLTFEEKTSAAWLHDLLNPRQPARGLLSAQRRSFEGRQQERPHRCAQAGRAIAHQPTQAGLPRRAGTAAILEPHSSQETRPMATLRAPTPKSSQSEKMVSKSVTAGFWCGI
jgi:hypothetical protein